MSEEKCMIQDIQVVTNPELLPRVRELKAEGYRLGQVCATTKKDGFQLLYSFDKDHVLLNLRLSIGMDEAVESVTDEYWHAFIYENEMHDLFGIEFLHNKLDYGGNFFKIKEETPWRDNEKAPADPFAAGSAGKEEAAAEASAAAPAEDKKPEQTGREGE
ncbi:MAG: NADH-quinone oxidoreductase subunit C [Anaerovoracaceae bacterium]|jgi:ech hydrogenase subunit D